jgi:hypothetical protein
MANNPDTFTITIRRRRWWGWTIAALWLMAELLFLQTALASMREGEYRAATVSWIVAAVFLTAGLVVWIRPQRPNKQVIEKVESETVLP